METWGNKKASETRKRSYVLPPAMRAAGVTIASVESVTAVIYDFSTVPDPSPGAILVTPAVPNTNPITLRNQQIAAGQAVQVSLTGGITGCSYVVSFLLKLSTGEDFAVDCLQRVSEYVPSP